MRREFAELLLARGETERAPRDCSSETLREAEAGGMSQLICRVQTRLAELQTSDMR